MLKVSLLTSKNSNREDHFWGFSNFLKLQNQ